MLTLIFLVGEATGYPHCRLACLNHKITNIRALHLNERLEVAERRIETQDQYIAWLETRTERMETKAAGFSAALKCLGEIPLSRYGEETGPSGYLFSLEGKEGSHTLATTALDITYPNDPVGAWGIVNICDQAGVMPSASLSSYARRFVKAWDQELVPVNRELLIEDFVGEENGEDRPSLSYASLFTDQAR